MSSPSGMRALEHPAVFKPKALAIAAILLVACTFVIRYVFFYYLHYNAAGFEGFWPRRGWLLVHITSGIRWAPFKPGVAEWDFPGVRDRSIREKPHSSHKTA